MLGTTLGCRISPATRSRSDDFSPRRPCDRPMRPAHPQGQSIVHTTSLPARGVGRNLDGIEVSGPVSPAHAAILTPDALRFIAGLQREFNARRHILLAQRRERQARFDAGQLPDFLHGTEADPRARLACRAAAGRPARPPRRNHRAGRSQDGHQRAQFRRELFHGRLRGLPFAHLGRHARRPDQSSATPSTARSTTCSPTPGSTTSSTSRWRRCMVRPRGWHLEERHVLRRPAADVGSLFDFGLFFYPQRAAS